MKKILNTIWVMGVLTLAVFCLSACDRDLDVQQSYPFTVETMPVQKDIIRGQTAEIRCTLKRGGEFADTRYTIRYFQSDGKGLLRMDNGIVFKPCSSLTTAIRLRRMCSVCTTPRSLPTARRLMYMWRIVSVRFSS